MKNILITGTSSGLGEALSKFYLNSGDKVYGIGRTNSLNHENFTFESSDLSLYENIEPALEKLCKDVKNFDLVVLNAGMLGEIKPITESSLEDLEKVTNLNVWSNKVILDILNSSFSVKQIVAISSGASVNGSFGWGAYSLSKATLNMLIKLYSHEMKNTHLSALAPGLILTPMLDYILNDIDDSIYDSIKRLKDSPKFTPEEIAPILNETFPKLLKFESGIFTDVRSMK